MIKSYLTLVTFFAVQHQVWSTEGAVDVEQGLHVLSRRSTNAVLRSDILKGPENAEETSKVPVDFDKIDEVTKPMEIGLITPVMKHHHHHHHHHHKHRSAKGNTTQTEDNTKTDKINETPSLKDQATTISKSELNETQEGTERVTENPSVTTQNKRFIIKGNGKVTPAFPFYRRDNYLDEEQRNKPQKWTHCLDLITPRLKGYKDEWRPKQFNNTHSDVLRLSQLLKVDVSNYTQEEIESILFQVSNIRLRLFRWDFSALTTIINLIIPDKTHTFRTLKGGLKALFVKWHLDTTMMSTFLKQTRIFRPPCIDTSNGFGLGSTKKSRVKFYTKPDKKKKNVESEHSASCDSQDKNYNIAIN